MAGTTQAMQEARRKARALGASASEIKAAGTNVLKFKKRGATNKEAVAAATIQGGGSVTARQGDSVFSIARREFGDERFAEQILSANRGLLGQDGLVRAGDNIFIPRLRTDKAPVVSFGGQAELLQLSDRAGVDVSDDFRKLGEQITNAGFGIDPETGRIVRGGTGITSGGDVQAPGTRSGPQSVGTRGSRKTAPAGFQGLNPFTDAPFGPPAPQSQQRFPIQDLPPGLQNLTQFLPPVPGQSTIGPSQGISQNVQRPQVPGIDPRTQFSGRGTGVNRGPQNRLGLGFDIAPRNLQFTNDGGLNEVNVALGGLSGSIGVDIPTLQTNPQITQQFAQAAGLSPSTTQTSGTNTAGAVTPSSTNLVRLPQEYAPPGRQPGDLIDMDREQMQLAEAVQVQQMLADDPSSAFMSDGLRRENDLTVEEMVNDGWQKTTAGWARQPGAGDSAFALPDVPGSLTAQEQNNIVEDIRTGNFSLLNPWASGVSPRIRFTGTRVRPIANNNRQPFQSYSVRNQNFTPALRGLTNWRQPIG